MHLGVLYIYIAHVHVCSEVQMSDKMGYDCLGMYTICHNLLRTLHWQDYLCHRFTKDTARKLETYWPESLCHQIIRCGHFHRLRSIYPRSRTLVLALPLGTT